MQYVVWGAAGAAGIITWPVSVPAVCTAELFLLIDSHGLRSHLYADDTQMYEFCAPNETLSLQIHLSACIDHVTECMRSNRLQLNAAKTEVLWSTTSRRLHQLPQSSLRVGSDLVATTAVVRNLGIFIDADVSMRSHVTRTVSSCFAILRQLRCIRRSVPRTVLQSLVSSLVLSRLDYGRHTGWHPWSSCSKTSICDECSCQNDFFRCRVTIISRRSCVSCIGRKLENELNASWPS